MSVSSNTAVDESLFHSIFVGCDEPMVPNTFPLESALFNVTYTSTSVLLAFLLNHKRNLCTPPGIIVNPSSGVINCSTKASSCCGTVVVTIRSTPPVGSVDNSLNPVSSTTESLKKYISPAVIPSLPDVPEVPEEPDVPLLPLVPEVPDSPADPFITKSLSVIPV
jgi:hypothetical protein